MWLIWLIYMAALKHPGYSILWLMHQMDQACSVPSEPSNPSNMTDILFKYTPHYSIHLWPKVHLFPHQLFQFIWLTEVGIVVWVWSNPSAYLIHPMTDLSLIWRPPFRMLQYTQSIWCINYDHTVHACSNQSDPSVFLSVLQTIWSNWSIGFDLSTLM